MLSVAICGGGAREGTMLLARLLLHFPLLPPLLTNGLFTFRCWFPDGWVCVHSRTLWVSPVDSFVRLGVSSTFTIPTEFYSQRFWVFSFMLWNPGFHGLSHSPVAPPSLSTHEWENNQSASHCLTCLGQSPALLQVLSAWLPISAPPTSLDECFFISLVVRIPCSLIFWQFWLVLFLNWLLHFFWLCEKVKHFYLYYNLGWNNQRLFLSLIFYL